MKNMLRSELNPDGSESPDPRPIVLDVSRRGRTMQENIQRLIRNELSRVSSEHGQETFDEANDFDVDDDDDTPISKYQEVIEEDYFPPTKRGAGGVPQDEGVPGEADLPAVGDKADPPTAKKPKPASKGGGPQYVPDLADFDMGDIEAEYLRRKYEEAKRKPK